MGRFCGGGACCCVAGVAIVGGQRVREMGLQEMVATEVDDVPASELLHSRLTTAVDEGATPTIFVPLGNSVHCSSRPSLSCA